MLPASVSRAFGALTLLYTAVAGCCGGAALPAVMSGADPAASAFDRVGVVVSVVLYLSGVIPAVAALLCSSLARPILLTWAVFVLTSEVISEVSYFASHELANALLASAVSVPVFCGWPAICLVALPFIGRAREAAVGDG